MRKTIDAMRSGNMLKIIPASFAINTVNTDELLPEVAAWVSKVTDGKHIPTLIEMAKADTLPEDPWRIISAVQNNDLEELLAYSKNEFPKLSSTMALIASLEEAGERYAEQESSFSI